MTGGTGGTAEAGGAAAIILHPRRVAIIRARSGFGALLAWMTIEVFRLPVALRRRHIAVFAVLLEALRPVALWRPVGAVGSRLTMARIGPVIAISALIGVRALGATGAVTALGPLTALGAFSLEARRHARSSGTAVFRHRPTGRRPELIAFCPVLPGLIGQSHTGEHDAAG